MIRVKRLTSQGIVRPFGGEKCTDCESLVLKSDHGSIIGLASVLIAEKGF